MEEGQCWPDRHPARFGLSIVALACIFVLGAMVVLGGCGTPPRWETNTEYERVVISDMKEAGGALIETYKFTDGPVTCYIYRGHSISCVRGL